MLLSERLPSGAKRWLDVEEMPLSRAAVYQALKLGWFDSVVVQFPGSQRKRRFIDALSVDRYFERLMAEQKKAKVTEKEEAV
jgi:hypothetical protein